MNKFLVRVLLVSGLIFSSGVMADLTPLRHFAEFSTWSQMRISPSGDYIAGVVDKNSGLGGSSLMVMDAKTLENLHETDNHALQEVVAELDTPVRLRSQSIFAIYKQNHDTNGSNNITE